jgi:fructokinase
MDIVCLGEVLIDMFPAELGRSLAEVSAFQPKPGGAPANVAVAAKRLGADSAFIGKVGDDDFGHHLAAILQQEGVNVSGMRYDDEARTGIAFIAMPDENSYDILFYRNPGADMRLRADELDRNLLASTRAFHFGSISLIQEPSRGATLEAARIAREAGALVSFDVNYRPDLWSRERACDRVLATIPDVDLLKVNEIEIELLTGSPDPATASQELLGLGPAICVVTMGPDGSYFCVPEGGAYIPPFRVKTVDATGCGDAFVAGLLWQLIGPGQDKGEMDTSWRQQLNPARLREVLRYANAVGALTSKTLGVIPALPTAAAVDQFLSEQE